MKKIFTIVFWLVFFTVFLSPVYGQDTEENFSVSNDITYTVSDSGNTHTAFNIGLTNTTSQYYASSYKVKIGFENLTNVTASDQEGSITPSVIKGTDGHTIDVLFNKPVVGINNTQKFTISFDTPDIAQNIGKVWEVNIPGVSNQNDFSSFNVHVRVPASFGDPSYIKPQFTKTLTSSGLNFSKEELQKAGISIAFGELQTYGFSLSYHLKNKNLFPIKTEIALPPTTNYQDISIDSLTPAPTQVKQDKDGNWLAEYFLLPGETKNIKAKGKVDLFLYPRRQIESEENLNKYLQEKPYWQTSNSEIKKLAQSLKTPFAIYEYVVKNLSYDFSRVSDSKSRVGASGVLKNPSSAVCLEFTDLFVALARAAGIPAREVDGFAFTENSKQRPLSKVLDILHAWPEYYDRDLATWIMVDPTWGNTTAGVDYFNILDFDHFAFVIKGENSNYPVPAGGYKLSESQDTKDVEVFFTQEKIKKVQNFQVEDEFPKFAMSSFPIEGKITLRNNGQTILDTQTVLIESENLSPSAQSLSFNAIPPYGYETISVAFDKTPFLTNKTDTITIRVAGKSFISKVAISPFSLNKQSIFIIGGILIAGICIFFISFTAIKARRVSVLKQNAGSTVRGEGQEPSR